MKRFIAVAGNVGAGKSTLTNLLCERLGWKPFFDSVEDNPYLDDFYRDMGTWSFHSQIFFLTRRLAHHRQILDRPDTVVQDRTVYEDAEIFARNLHLQGLMGQRDWDSYWPLYQAVIAILPPPDLVIYLQASVPVLLGRIAQSGHQHGREITAEYLTQLAVLYDAWEQKFDACRMLVVHTDNFDIRDETQLGLLIGRVQAKLH